MISIALSGWQVLCFKQNVGGASGHGLPAINRRQERAPTHERRFSSQGKIKRFCESTKLGRPLFFLYKILLTLYNKML